MTSLEELRAAVTNQRFATGNDDALLGRAIVELANKVAVLEETVGKNAMAEAMLTSDEGDDET